MAGDIKENQGAGAKWDDLAVRLTSGLAMAVVGISAIVLGGVWFEILAIFVTAIMVWELWSMIAPDRPKPALLLSVLTAAILAGVIAGGGWFALLFIVVPVTGAALLPRAKVTFALYALGIQLAGWGLVTFRAESGTTWMLWLILVVVATDVFGYFAGRIIGGAKFWPSISPKKTWSGTVAGWLSAAMVGLIFMSFTEVGFEIVIFSMVLSFAGQMGDIAESAIKRRMGIKDSSDLIPGHGGFLDRFDAVLGASLFLLLVGAVTGFPGVAS